MVVVVMEEETAEKTKWALGQHSSLCCRSDEAERKRDSSPAMPNAATTTASLPTCLRPLDWAATDIDR